MSLVPQSIFAYLMQLPVYLVWLAGVVLCVYNWQRHPRPARITLIALVVLFLTSLAGTALSSWLPFFLHAQGMAASRMGLISTLIGVIRAVLNALGFGLLLAAIFGWRQAA